MDKVYMVMERGERGIVSIFKDKEKADELTKRLNDKDRGGRRFKGADRFYVDCHEFSDDDPFSVIDLLF